MTADEDRDGALLEAIALRTVDLFSVTPPDAPGAFFSGALFDAGEGATRQRFSAGAVDVTPEAARRRCLGEVAETLAQFAAPADLGARAHAIDLDDDEWVALETLSGNNAGPGLWLPGFRVGGSAASIPAALCLRGETSASGPVSSLGCAAGATREKAVDSALCELAERDAVALWWHGGRQAQAAEAALTDLDGIVALVKRLRQDRNNRPMRLLDLTTDLNIACAAAVSFDPDGRRLAIGFGAALSLDEACRKAILEMIQMELGNHIAEMKAARLSSEALSAADIAILQRLESLNIAMLPFDAAERPAPDTPRMETDKFLADFFLAAGIEVYGADLSAGPEHIPVVKLLAPRLQPLPMLWQTGRLADCQKVHAERLAHFPIADLL